MELVRPALEHRVSNKPAALAIFGRVAVGDDAIFLDGIGRDRGRSATFIVEGDLASPCLTLFVVVSAVDKVTASATAGTVYFRAAIVVRAILRHSPGNQFNERILVADLQRHLLPDSAIYQLRQIGLGRLDGFDPGLHRDLFAGLTDF